MNSALHRTMIFWTRDVGVADVSGRTNILKGIRKAAFDRGSVIECVATNVFAGRKAFAGLAVFVAALASGALLGKPLPLQCALYSDRRMNLHLDQIDADTIVFDSVRHIRSIRRIRANNSKIRIVVDMDDLMSRRVQLLIEKNLDVSLGLFAGEMPGMFARMLRNKWLSRLLMRYEAFTLKRVEEEICRLVDQVVMVSKLEADLLDTRLGGRSRARILAVPPPISEPTSVRMFADHDADRPVRFAFIGSDRVIQNRTSIDWLLDRWRSNKPSSQLVIAGRQSRTYANVPANVSMLGFVDDVAEIYDGRTILLSPTFLSGGVKTKFLEAFAHGTTVVGTKSTFEGVDQQDCFIVIKENEWPDFLEKPDAHVDYFSQSARSGYELVAQKYTFDNFVIRWCEII